MEYYPKTSELGGKSTVNVVDVKIWIKLLQSVIFDPDRNELNAAKEISENGIWTVMNCYNCLTTRMFSY